MPSAHTVLWAAALLAAGTLSAQDGPRGHWTGAIDLPNQSLQVKVDLDKTPQGWIGSASVPAQNATGIPLDAIAFADGKCTFRFKGGPGDPTFKGNLSQDGKTLSGDFTQGPGSFPFKLTRSGDPKVEVMKDSLAVAKEFLGTWEGALDAGGQTLRLVLKLSNEANGAKGTLISVDQGGAEIPVASIEQTGMKLSLTVRVVGGEFKGEINTEGTDLTGTWTQGGNDLPLKLKKAK